MLLTIAGHDAIDASRLHDRCTAHPPWTCLLCTAGDSLSVQGDNPLLVPSSIVDIHPVIRDIVSPFYCGTCSPTCGLQKYQPQSANSALLHNGAPDNGAFTWRPGLHASGLAARDVDGRGVPSGGARSLWEV